MNTRLKTLFEVYKIHKKDRHEIWQIFSLLPPEKQIKFLNNFPKLAHDLKVIQDQITQEREILLDQWFKKIYHAIDQVKQQQLAK